MTKDIQPHIENALEYAPIDREQIGATRLSTKELSGLVEQNLFNLLLASCHRATMDGEKALAENLLNLLVTFVFDTAEKNTRVKHLGNLGITIHLAKQFGGTFKASKVKRILVSLLRDSLILPHVGGQTSCDGSSNENE